MARATLTNQLARVAPATYVRLTRQTGRGAAAEESPRDIEDLACLGFWTVFRRHS